MSPNSRLVPDPVKPLTLEMAAMVAGGKISPKEADSLRYHGKTTQEVHAMLEAIELNETRDTDDDQDNDNASEASEVSSDISWSEDDMAAMLLNMSIPQGSEFDA